MGKPNTMGEAGASIKYGAVVAIDPERGWVRVSMPHMGGLPSPWLPVPQRGTTSARHYALPDLGEQLAFLLDANGDQGVVLGGVYSETDPAPCKDGKVQMVEFEDGTSVAYDRGSKKLSLRCAGDIEIAVTGVLKISAQSIEIAGEDGDVVVAGVSLVKHVHGQVQPGMGESGKPVAE
jgi:phage baseplate assembly protein V